MSEREYKLTILKWANDAALSAERSYVKAAADVAAAKAAKKVYDELDPDRCVGSFDREANAVTHAEERQVTARRHFEFMKEVRDYAVKTFI